MIPSAPTSACYTIILYPAGTYLDGNECCSLIGLTSFLLQCTRCCHGFGWGCATVFFPAPSVLGVSWVENGVISLIFSLGVGVGVASAVLPLLCLHTGTRQHGARHSKDDSCPGLDLVNLRLNTVQIGSTPAKRPRRRKRTRSEKNK